MQFVTRYKSDRKYCSNTCFGFFARRFRSCRTGTAQGELPGGSGVLPVCWERTWAASHTDCVHHVQPGCQQQPRHLPSFKDLPTKPSDSVCSPHGSVFMEYVDQQIQLLLRTLTGHRVTPIIYPTSLPLDSHFLGSLEHSGRKVLRSHQRDRIIRGEKFIPARKSFSMFLVSER